MHRILSGLLVLLAGVAPAGAQTLSLSTPIQGVEVAQSSPSVTIGPGGITVSPNSRDRDRDRDRRPPPPPRREQFVCVVQPPPSMDRRRPYVCDARPGRVGERCRCDGVVGSGRLDIDR